MNNKTSVMHCIAVQKKTSKWDKISSGIKMGEYNKFNTLKNGKSVSHNIFICVKSNMAPIIRLGLFFHFLQY